MLTHASFCNGGASRRPVGVATAPAAYVEGRFRPLQWHRPDPVHDGCSSCARDGMKSTYGCCRTGCVLGRNRGAAPPRALARSRWKMRGQTSACRHGGQVSAWLGPPHGYVSFAVEAPCIPCRLRAPRARECSHRSQNRLHPSLSSMRVPCSRIVASRARMRSYGPPYPWVDWPKCNTEYPLPCKCRTVTSL